MNIHIHTDGNKVVTTFGDMVGEAHTLHGDQFDLAIGVCVGMLKAKRVGWSPMISFVFPGLHTRLHARLNDRQVVALMDARTRYLIAVNKLKERRRQYAIWEESMKGVPKVGDLTEIYATQLSNELTMRGDK